jgi:hypothetical protein
LYHEWAEYGHGAEGQNRSLSPLPEYGVPFEGVLGRAA